MKFNAHMLRRAARDVELIATWLHQRSPQGADAWLRRWTQTFEALQLSSAAHGLAPEDEGQELEIRQVFFRTRKGRDYRALYTIRDRDVYVMHIRGPGQDLVPADEVGGIDM